jgi:hypothetical protein
MAILGIIALEKAMVVKTGREALESQMWELPVLAIPGTAALGTAVMVKTGREALESQAWEMAVTARTGRGEPVSRV